MAEQKKEDNGTESEDVEAKSTPSETDTSAPGDKPPNPPKRDYADENRSIEADSGVEYASVNKRKKLGSFPTRPEFVYKPDNPEARMACIRNILVIFNLIIWVLGAVITALGIWIKVDSDFFEIQTNLDMKQFTTASYVLIIVGVLVMLVGFLGCYGVIASKMCMLIIFSIIVSVVILLEIAVMAIVWTSTNNKNFKEDIRLKATIAMREIMTDKEKLYFFNLIQAKLECCGANNKEDYFSQSGYQELPNSCISKETGQPYERGCYDAVVHYLIGKAAIVGGVAAAIFLLQVCLLIFTIFFICGIKESASSSIF